MIMHNNIIYSVEIFEVLAVSVIASATVGVTVFLIIVVALILFLLVIIYRRRKVTDNKLSK